MPNIPQREKGASQRLLCWQDLGCFGQLQQQRWELVKHHSSTRTCLGWSLLSVSRQAPRARHEGRHLESEGAGRCGRCASFWGGGLSNNLPVSRNGRGSKAKNVNVLLGKGRKQFLSLAETTTEIAHESSTNTFLSTEQDDRRPVMSSRNVGRGSPHIPDGRQPPRGAGESKKETGSSGSMCGKSRNVVVQVTSYGWPILMLWRQQGPRPQRTSNGCKTVVMCNAVSELPCDGPTMDIAKAADGGECLLRTTGPIRKEKTEQQALFCNSSRKLTCGSVA